MEVRATGETVSSEWERAGSDSPAEGSGDPSSERAGSDPPAEGSGDPRSERAGSDPAADGSRNLGLESSESDLPVGSNENLGSDSLAGGCGSSEMNLPAGRRGMRGSHPPAGKMQSWVVQQDAQMLSASLKVDPCREAKELTESIEEMLIRLDEFCGMLDMIRNDSSQILDESIPKLKVKALEMKEVYSKIDKMETAVEFYISQCKNGQKAVVQSSKEIRIFVKMVEQSAAMLEEQVIQAEKDCGNVSWGVCRFLHSINAPFLNKKRNCISQQNLAYELPNLYRTEAYFPATHNRTFFKPNE